jgi:hypothetical protein
VKGFVINKTIDRNSYYIVQENSCVTQKMAAALSGYHFAFHCQEAGFGFLL